MLELIKYDINKNFNQYFKNAEGNKIYNKLFLPLYSQKEGKVSFKQQKETSRQIIDEMGPDFV